jgi:hypothetical protein
MLVTRDVSQAPEPVVVADITGRIWVLIDQAVPIDLDSRARGRAAGGDPSRGRDVRGRCRREALRVRAAAWPGVLVFHVRARGMTGGNENGPAQWRGRARHSQLA